jgi:hypothetical protein
MSSTATTTAVNDRAVPSTSAPPLPSRSPTATESLPSKEQQDRVKNILEQIYSILNPKPGNWTRSQADRRLKRIRNLATSMDQIPGLPVKVGLDSIIGLIPVVGDLATSAISCYQIYLSRQLGVPKRVVFKMLVNCGIDFAIGSVPLVGDLFDVMFKANMKNCELLENWYKKNLHLFEDDTTPEPEPVAEPKKKRRLFWSSK